MQNTRLDLLPLLLWFTLDRWLRNPIRLVLVQILAALLGFFLGISISTTTGQEGIWDIVVVVIMIAAIEVISWWYYRPGKRSAIGGVVNTFKLGVTASYLLEAFKLAS